MITDNDIKKLRSVFATKDDLGRFATKDDLGRFATKDDLGRFATKDDLGRFATKDDLGRFATKDDLEKLESRIGKSFIETQQQIFDLTHVVANLDKKFVTRDEFVTFEDHILGEIRTLFQENLVRSEHRREIDDHEKRITKLEKFAFAN